MRCQVRGTDADVNANRAKTVNTWLTPVIFERSLRGKAPGRSYTPCARESMVPVFNVAGPRMQREDTENTKNNRRGKSVIQAPISASGTLSNLETRRGFHSNPIMPERNKREGSRTGERDEEGGRCGEGTRDCIGPPSLLL